MRLLVVIPTHNSPAELEGLIYSLRDNRIQPDDTLIINNGHALPRWFDKQGTIIQDRRTEPHIYEQWNFGLEWAQFIEPDSYVAILNDDVELPPNFADDMSNHLRLTDSTIAFPNQHDEITRTLNSHGNIDLRYRMTGYCFMVNNAHGLRCDTAFKWWYGDDDLDRRARSMRNGTVQVGNVRVKHLHPNESTNSSAVRSEQTKLDRATFIRKHGVAPW
jgi:hypothetical protein